MHLSNLKLWNFRKFGTGKEFKITDKSHLDLNFKKGLNVLIGENDSGKSAIIDAIKLVLKTHSYEWINVDKDDFCNDSHEFRIELIFENMNDDEAKNFTELLGWKKVKKKKGDAEIEEDEPYLKLNYHVTRNDERIFPTEVRAGIDEDGYPLNPEAKEYLKCTYLKPLRDAVNELVGRKGSRLSQILQNHEAFKGKKQHHLIEIFKEFNDSIAKYFEGNKIIGKDQEGNLIIEKLKDDTKGQELKEKIDEYIQSFYSLATTTTIKVTADADLKSILERLELSINKNKNPGLGTLNRLFMAAELLHLNKDNWHGLRLGLIEELEAHLHPQAQMQVIEALQGKSFEENGVQLILTTHSANLASKVKLENLIICNSNNAFPMGTDEEGKEYSGLAKDGFKYLEKFLDVTKSNLFFAKGIILVEGWAEELLIDSLARSIGFNLTQKKVSVINVGNTGLDRFSKIFIRRNGDKMDIKVALIQDLDILPIIAEPDMKNSEPAKKRKEEDVKAEAKIQIENLEKKYNFYDGKELENIKVHISPEWTLEWCLSKSLSIGKEFQNSVKKVHPNKYKTGDFDENLADHLKKKGLKKTEIAYDIALKLDEDLAMQTAQINIDENDNYIKYLLDAIKYACQD